MPTLDKKNATNQASKGAEEIFRDFIGDLFPLVVFLSVFYVVFWFFKKDK